MTDSINGLIYSNELSHARTGGEIHDIVRSLTKMPIPPVDRRDIIRARTFARVGNEIVHSLNARIHTKKQDS